jgi:nucleoid-associated protein YgaU
MAISYTDLVDYRGLVQGSAESWAYFLAGVNSNAEYFQTNVSKPTGEVWTGIGSELAEKHFQATNSDLIKLGSNVGGIKSVLTNFDDQLNTYQKQMKQLVDAIEKGGELPFGDGVVEPNKWAVSPGGIVGIRPGWTPPDPQTYGPRQAEADETARNGLQNDIQAILDQATAADESAANKLRKYLPEPAYLAPANETVGHWTTVSSNGSLWQIAQQEYGDPNLWKKIYDYPANQKLIGTDPGLIQPGMKLYIPALNTAGTPHPTQPDHPASSGHRRRSD